MPSCCTASAGGITTEFVMNVVENSGGFYESMAIANVLPDKMKMLAEHIDANYKAMSELVRARVRRRRPRPGSPRPGRHQTRGHVDSILTAFRLRTALL